MNPNNPKPPRFKSGLFARNAATRRDPTSAGGEPLSGTAISPARERRDPPSPSSPNPKPPRFKSGRFAQSPPTRRYPTLAAGEPPNVLGTAICPRKRPDPPSPSSSPNSLANETGISSQPPSPDNSQGGNKKKTWLQKAVNKFVPNKKQKNEDSGKNGNDNAHGSEFHVIRCAQQQSHFQKQRIALTPVAERPTVSRGVQGRPPQPTTHVPPTSATPPSAAFAPRPQSDAAGVANPPGDAKRSNPDQLGGITSNEHGNENVPMTAVGGNDDLLGACEAAAVALLEARESVRNMQSSEAMPVGAALNNDDSLSSDDGADVVEAARARKKRNFNSFLKGTKKRAKGAFNALNHLATHSPLKKKPKAGCSPQKGYASKASVDHGHNSPANGNSKLYPDVSKDLGASLAGNTNEPQFYAIAGSRSNNPNAAENEYAVLMPGGPDGDPIEKQPRKDVNSVSVGLNQRSKAAATEKGESLQIDLDDLEAEMNQRDIVKCSEIIQEYACKRLGRGQAIKDPLGAMRRLIARQPDKLGMPARKAKGLLEFLIRLILASFSGDLTAEELCKACYLVLSTRVAIQEQGGQCLKGASRKVCSRSVVAINVLEAILGDTGMGDGICEADVLDAIVEYSELIKSWHQGDDGNNSLLEKQLIQKALEKYFDAKMRCDGCDNIVETALLVPNKCGETAGPDDLPSNIKPSCETWIVHKILGTQSPGHVTVDSCKFSVVLIDFLKSCTGQHSSYKPDDKSFAGSPEKAAREVVHCLRGYRADNLSWHDYGEVVSQYSALVAKYLQTTKSVGKGSMRAYLDSISLGGTRVKLSIVEMVRSWAELASIGKLCTVFVSAVTLSHAGKQCNTSEFKAESETNDATCRANTACESKGIAHANTTGEIVGTSRQLKCTAYALDVSGRRVEKQNVSRIDLLVHGNGIARTSTLSVASMIRMLSCDDSIHDRALQVFWKDATHAKFFITEDSNEIVETIEIAQGSSILFGDALFLRRLASGDPSSSDPPLPGPLDDTPGSDYSPTANKTDTITDVHGNRAPFTNQTGLIPYQPAGLLNTTAGLPGTETNQTNRYEISGPNPPKPTPTVVKNIGVEASLIFTFRAALNSITNPTTAKKKPRLLKKKLLTRFNQASERGESTPPSSNNVATPTSFHTPMSKGSSQKSAQSSSSPNSFHTPEKLPQGMSIGQLKDILDDPFLRQKAKKRLDNRNNKFRKRKNKRQRKKAALDDQDDGGDKRKKGGGTRQKKGRECADKVEKDNAANLLNAGDDSSDNSAKASDTISFQLPHVRLALPNCESLTKKQRETRTSFITCLNSRNYEPAWTFWENLPTDYRKKVAGASDVDYRTLEDILRISLTCMESEAETGADAHAHALNKPQPMVNHKGINLRRDHGKGDGEVHVGVEDDTSNNPNSNTENATGETAGSESSDTKPAHKAGQPASTSRPHDSATVKPGDKNKGASPDDPDRGDDSKDSAKPSDSSIVIPLGGFRLKLPSCKILTDRQRETLDSFICYSRLQLPELAKDYWKKLPDEFCEIMAQANGKSLDQLNRKLQWRLFFMKPHACDAGVHTPGEPRKMVPGLNRCYNNSGMQAFFCQPEIAESLRELLLEDRYADPNGTKEKFATTLKGIIDALLSNGDFAVDSHGLREAFRDPHFQKRVRNWQVRNEVVYEKVDSAFCGDDQQDIAEFLGFVVEKLCDMFPNICNRFDDLLVSKVETVLTCQHCQVARHDTDAETFLCVGIPPGPNVGTPTIQECIDGFIDYMTDDQVNCPECARNERPRDLPESAEFEVKRTHKMTKRVVTTPKLVTVHLQRFDNSNGISEKLEVPVEALDVIKIGDVRKNLRAVICHAGTLESGHYFCYVQRRGKWFECNDDNITCVDCLKKVLDMATKHGYIFIYGDTLPEPSAELTATSTVRNPGQPIGVASSSSMASILGQPSLLSASTSARRPSTTDMPKSASAEKPDCIPEPDDKRDEESGLPTPSDQSATDNTTSSEAPSDPSGARGSLLTGTLPEVEGVGGFPSVDDDDEEEEEDTSSEASPDPSHVGGSLRTGISPEVEEGGGFPSAVGNVEDDNDDVELEDGDIGDPSNVIQRRAQAAQRKKDLAFAKEEAIAFPNFRKIWNQVESMTRPQHRAALREEQESRVAALVTALGEDFRCEANSFIDTLRKSAKNLNGGMSNNFANDMPLLAERRDLSALEFEGFEKTKDPPPDIKGFVDMRHNIRLLDDLPRKGREIDTLACGSMGLNQVSGQKDITVEQAREGTMQDNPGSFEKKMDAAMITVGGMLKALKSNDTEFYRFSKVYYYDKRERRFVKLGADFIRAGRLCYEKKHGLLLVRCSMIKDGSEHFMVFNFWAGAEWVYDSHIKERERRHQKLLESDFVNDESTKELLKKLSIFKVHDIHLLQVDVRKIDQTQHLHSTCETVGPPDSLGQYCVGWEDLRHTNRPDLGDIENWPLYKGLLAALGDVEGFKDSITQGLLKRDHDYESIESLAAELNELFDDEDVPFRLSKVTDSSFENVTGFRQLLKTANHGIFALRLKGSAKTIIANINGREGVKASLFHSEVGYKDVDDGRIDKCAKAFLRKLLPPKSIDGHLDGFYIFQVQRERWDESCHVPASGQPHHYGNRSWN